MLNAHCCVVRTFEIPILKEDKINIEGMRSVFSRREPVLGRCYMPPNIAHPVNYCCVVGPTVLLS